MTKIFKNLKMRILSKKLLKFVIFKSWNLFHANKKFFSNLLSNSWWGFLAPGTQTTWIMTKNVEKYEKIARFVKKYLNSWWQKVENHSITTKNYAGIYHQTLYQTPEEISWHLGIKKLKKWQKFSKNLKKIEKISILSRVCVCSTKTYSS